MVCGSAAFCRTHVYRNTEGKSAHYIYSASHSLVDLGWVDFNLGVPLGCTSMHVTQLPGFFCQIPVRPFRIGPTMEHLKFKSTQPSPRANGHPVNKLSTIVLKFMATCLTIVLSKAAIETQVFREE